MPVTRQDLIIKSGVYTIGQKEGEWIVNSHIEHPQITMQNIETGELFDMGMTSMFNVRALRVRELGDDEQVAEPQQKVIIKEVERELTDDEVGETVNGIAALMLKDGLELISMIISEGKKPTKERIDQLTSWKEQVDDFLVEEVGSNEIENQDE